MLCQVTPVGWNREVLTAGAIECRAGSPGRVLWRGVLTLMRTAESVGDKFGEHIGKTPHLNYPCSRGTADSRVGDPDVV